MEMGAMKFKAVTVSTIGIPPMEFCFEVASVNAAMEFMCRSVPLMRGSPSYDFELFYIPEEGVDVPMGGETAPKLIGRTKSVITTRFIKEPGAHVSVAATVTGVHE
jgi:hypothetical protein